MPIYLVLAYVIFVTVPLGLGLSIFWRRRRVERRLDRYRAAPAAQKPTPPPR